MQISHQGLPYCQDIFSSATALFQKENKTQGEVGCFIFLLLELS